MSDINVFFSATNKADGLTKLQAATTNTTVVAAGTGVINTLKDDGPFNFRLRASLDPANSWAPLMLNIILNPQFQRQPVSSGTTSSGTGTVSSGGTVSNGGTTSA
jgi:hypothetical protein